MSCGQVVYACLFAYAHSWNALYENVFLILTLPINKNSIEICKDRHYDYGNSRALGIGIGLGSGSFLALGKEFLLVLVVVLAKLSD